MTFNNWIDTLVSEKGYDREFLFELPGNSGANLIPLGVVIDMMKSWDDEMKKFTKDKLVMIDFKNGSCLDFFKYIAEKIVI